jgi:tRNA-dihydrouridine synthase
MLKDIALLSLVLREMRKATHLPLSAKIRAGYDSASGVVDIARAVQDAGVDYLAVHPRRRVDFYEGVADWRIIARLVQELDIPVVGNGDIWYAEDAMRMQVETGCAAVMLGRPALRNPWIFLQLESLRRGETPVHPDGPMVLAHLKTLGEALLEGYPSRGALGMMKEQLRYVGRIVPDPVNFTRRALRSQHMDEMLEVSAETLSSLSAADLDLQASSGTRERSGSALAPSPDDSPSRGETCGSASAFGLTATV